MSLSNGTNIRNEHGNHLHQHYIPGHADPYGERITKVAAGRAFAVSASVAANYYTPRNTSATMRIYLSDNSYISTTDTEIGSGLVQVVPSSSF